MDVKAVIETTLKAEIVKALNAAPDAIEKLVTAAISAEVGDRSGNMKPEYYEKKVPYLDFLIGEEVRRAAESAVKEVFASRAEEIKAAVKKRFSADDIVDGFARHLIEVGNQDWRIDVKFKSDKDR